MRNILTNYLIKKASGSLTAPQPINPVEDPEDSGYQMSPAPQRTAPNFGPSTPLLPQPVGRPLPKNGVDLSPAALEKAVHPTRTPNNNTPYYNNDGMVDDNGKVWHLGPQPAEGIYDLEDTAIEGEPLEEAPVWDKSPTYYGPELQYPEPEHYDPNDLVPTWTDDELLPPDEPVRPQTQRQPQMPSAPRVLPSDHAAPEHYDPNELVPTMTDELLMPQSQPNARPNRNVAGLQTDDYRNIFGKNFNPNANSRLDAWLALQADKLRRQGYDDRQISTMLNRNAWRRYGRKNKDYVVNQRKYRVPGNQVRLAKQANVNNNMNKLANYLIKKASSIYIPDELRQQSVSAVPSVKNLRLNARRNEILRKKWMEELIRARDVARDEAYTQEAQRKSNQLNGVFDKAFPKPLNPLHGPAFEPTHDGGAELSPAWRGRTYEPDEQAWYNY